MTKKDMKNFAKENWGIIVGLTATAIGAGMFGIALRNSSMVKKATTKITVNAKNVKDRMNAYKGIDDLWDLTDAWEDNGDDMLIVNDVSVEQLGYFGKKLLECAPDAKAMHIVGIVDRKATVKNLEP